MSYLTDKEIELINNSNGDIDKPFRILQITNEEDLTFLRKKSIDIPIVDESDNNNNFIKNDKELQLFIARLKATLKLKGVGIAAPQVGFGRNIFLFIRVNKPDRPIQVAINPKIINQSNNIIGFEGDGCLSVPDQSGTTNRFEWIDVEYFNENGELIKERLSGISRQTDFTGIIFQHEFDHLNGILFIDKLKN